MTLPSRTSPGACVYVRGKGFDQTKADYVHWTIDLSKKTQEVYTSILMNLYQCFYCIYTCSFVFVCFFCYIYIQSIDGFVVC